MDLGLSDRVYIVSGASTGLGLECARLLADERSLLVLHASDEEELAAVAPGIGDPSRILLVPGDISDPGTETRLVAAANARFGRLDGAVISCGTAPTSTVLEAADGTWREAFESSLLGPLRLARSVGKAATGEGASMVMLLSSTVRTPVMDAGVANGLRPGLAMAAKALADELGPRGVRINNLLAGHVDSSSPLEFEDSDDLAPELLEGIPLRRAGLPDEFARAAVFLLSPAASYITGASLTVDGGTDRSL
ncbi:SDR family oxidoreductase [Kineococcus aurantiacus]|uniref:3-oxoacyl-[acyl-carrier protein] reductase n=1 Tax=Kineococcus aurantiacus TaxID=37633 RepID=A0A7Y9DJE2_9ACTN|nr:SDR family oxidoreductase [Kineococcus aurantiacus]NYD20697.1 3-oxoacyl-[acyl-carrier protein] reductase [Kineococcus aurantiacus]